MTLHKSFLVTVLTLALGTLGFTPGSNSIHMPLIIYDSPVGCTHLPPVQEKNANVLTFPAEQYCRISDSDQDGMVFSIQEGGGAHGRYVVKAPSESSPRNSPGESHIIYKLRFSEAGSYHLYLRVRAFHRGADSFFIPKGFNRSPSEALHIGDVGRFVWREAPFLFEVTSAELGKELELHMGAREHFTELDSLAFVKVGADASAARLDAELGYFAAMNATFAGGESLREQDEAILQDSTELWQVGSSLDFGYIPVEERLYITYALGDAMGKQASVYVNGKDVATAQFASTGSWNDPATTFVYLPNGGHVRLQIDADDYIVNLKDPSASIDHVSIGETGRERFFTDAGALASALATASAGDTFILADGNYVDQHLAISASGTPIHPITLRAQTAGGVNFYGRSSLSITGSYIVVDGINYIDPLPSLQVSRATALITVGTAAHHNRLTNISVANYKVDTQFNVNEDGEQIRYIWLNIRGTHTLVEHSYFSNKPDHGAVMVLKDYGEPLQATYNVIVYNYFERRKSTGRNGAETIAIDDPSKDAPLHTRVAYNLFFKCDGEGECISNKSTGNYYFYNTIRDSTGWLVLRQGHHAWIEGNVFVGGSGGIRVHGSDHVIVNNHFQTLATGLLLAGGQSDLLQNPTCYAPVEGIVIAHNTFADVKLGIAIQEKSCGDIAGNVWPSKIIFANNLVSGGNFTLKQAPEGSVDFAPFNNVTTLSDAPTGWSLSGVSYRFDNSGIWRPIAGSSVVDAAQTDSDIRAELQRQYPGYPEYPFVGTDQDGQLRSAGPDVGADEVGISPDATNELNRQDVGPKWGQRLVPG